MWKQLLLKSEWKTNDIISSNKVRQLNNLLPSPATISNSVLPLLYHFMYLTPSSTTKDLDSDGYDSYQSPPTFQRRLWVGGSIKIHKDIRIGSPATLTEKVRRIREMKGATLVEIERAIENEGGAALTEIRKLMYLESLYSPVDPMFSEQAPRYSTEIQLTPLDLMRYSALTYNSHKIHYDSCYSKEIEHYPDILVHGPLLVTLAANFIKLKMPLVEIHEMKYKNIQPLFVSNVLKLNCAEIEEKLHVWITNEKEEMCFSGIIN